MVVEDENGDDFGVAPVLVRLAGAGDSSGA
jgi:hypothetical protein